MIRAVGLGVGGMRAATGLWFLLAPTAPTRAWVGDTSNPVRYLARAVGGRDLAIGLGAVAASLRREPVWPWLGASIVGDLTDATVSTVMVSGSQRRTAIAFAGGFALLTAVAWAMSTRPS